MLINLKLNSVSSCKGVCILLWGFNIIMISQVQNYTLSVREYEIILLYTP